MNNELLEKLAEVEHNQWVEWSKSMVRNENVTKETLNRWLNLWVPYSELTEDEKNSDRRYARKVLDIINEK